MATCGTCKLCDSFEKKVEYWLLRPAAVRIRQISTLTVHTVKHSASPRKLSAITHTHTKPQMTKASPPSCHDPPPRAVVRLEFLQQHTSKRAGHEMCVR